VKKKNDGNDASRIQWILNERKCQGLQHRLSQHRESLHGLLVTVHSVQMYVHLSFQGSFHFRMQLLLCEYGLIITYNLWTHFWLLIAINRESHRRVSDITLQLVKEILAMMNGDRPLLLQQSVGADNVMNGETELIITQETTLSQVSSTVAIFHDNFERATRIISATATSIPLLSGQSNEIANHQPRSSSLGEKQRHELCEVDCACTCHTTFMDLPPSLDPVYYASTAKLHTRFVRKCSIRECRVRRSESRVRILSTRNFKNIVGVSLLARSYHTLIHLKSAKIVPEAADYNWTLLHVG